MPLLLCRKEAETPFHFEKLNINIRSEQELCYLITSYPLVCFDGFISSSLISWIGESLHMTSLYEKLKESVKSGDSVENQVILILRESNYYDFNEIKRFRDELCNLRNLSEAEKNRRLGRILFRAGLYSFAAEKFEAALRLFDAEILHSGETKEREKLTALKADVYCDLAVICLNMFDEKQAVENLMKSEICSYNKRAVRMRYLINGTGDISDKEKSELDKQKQLAIDRVAKSPEIAELNDIFAKDRETMFEKAGSLIENWKNDYRRMI